MKNTWCPPVDCCGEMMVRDYTLDEAVNRAIDILNEHLGANFSYNIIGAAEELCGSDTKYYLRIALLGNLYVRVENLKDAWQLAEKVVGDVLNNIQWNIENWEDR